MKRKLLKMNFLMKAINGFIPEKHISILSSSLRDKQGWVDERIRKIYIKAATTLAFRKLQSRNSHGLSKMYYENDVTNYRNFIHELLKHEAA
jgi:hypothetical protein